MILVDFSGMIFAAVHVSMAQEKSNDLVMNKNLLRHFILNQVRNIHKKFHKTYGELVICLDHGPSWRKQVIPAYKYRRSVDRQESDIDWTTVYGWVNDIIAEIKENLPYKVIDVEGAEGDDVIATIIWNRTGSDKSKKTLIVSNDKDLRQLQKHTTQYVKQYSPMKDAYLPPMSENELFCMICKGDTTDGICNIRSANDTFTIPGARQKPVSEKMLKEWMSNGIPDELSARFKENEICIDLGKIPYQLQDKIVYEYDKNVRGNRNKMFAYFGKNGLNEMLRMIGDF